MTLTFDGFQCLFREVCTGRVDFDTNEGALYAICNGELVPSYPVVNSQRPSAHTVLTPRPMSFSESLDDPIGVRVEGNGMEVSGSTMKHRIDSIVHIYNVYWQTYGEVEFRPMRHAEL